MIIEKININDVNQAVYNPRIALKTGDVEYEKLKNSIKTFGYVEPLVWNRRTGTLVSGHQRLAVLKEEGFEDVSVSVVDLPLEKEKALNLALNKIRGDWDEVKLANILDELVKLPDFDEGLSGFDGTEVSKILDAHIVSINEDFDVNKEIGAIGEPVTRLGDVIQLGNHRIVCGDSVKEEAYRAILGQEKIALVHMDLPYGVSYDAKNRPGTNQGNELSQWIPIQNDDLKGDAHSQWFGQILGVMKPFLKENASVYFWDGFINFGPLTQELTKNGFHVSNIITWVKPTACPSFADYWFKSEYLLYGWLKSKKPHRWFGPNGESNVWQIDREPMGDYQHPTMKPTELACRVIKNSSIRGDIVFDGCMGAGFNLIACQEMGRMFRGIEIEPIYCDVAVRRFIRLFGKNSVSAEVFEKYGKELVNL